MISVYAMLSNPSITKLPEITVPTYSTVAHKDVPTCAHKAPSPRSETSLLNLRSFDYSVNPSVYPSINDDSMMDLGPR